MWQHCGQHCGQRSTQLPLVLSLLIPTPCLNLLTFWLRCTCLFSLFCLFSCFFSVSFFLLVCFILFLLSACLFYSLTCLSCISVCFPCLFCFQFILIFILLTCLFSYLFVPLFILFVYLFLCPCKMWPILFPAILPLLTSPPLLSDQLSSSCSGFVIAYSYSILLLSPPPISRIRLVGGSSESR